MTLPIDQLRDGDLIFTRDRASLSGALIRNLHGDFDWSHVCSYWNGFVYTTGARWDWRKLAYVYGRVPVREYLAQRTYCVGRRSDLSAGQQSRRWWSLMDLLGSPYALAKVLRLAAKGRSSAGVVNQLNFRLDLNPDKVFCAEAEAYGLMQAGAVVNSKYPHKVEPCVHTVESLFDAPETVIL